MKEQYRNVSDDASDITIGKTYVGEIIGIGLYFLDDVGAQRRRPSDRYEKVQLPAGGNLGIGETDPTGLDLHTPGAKGDAGKPMVAQILSQFPRALAGVAEVGTFGAKKYSLGGWLKVPNGMARYADAGLRHFLARARGEKFDPESKLHHLKHETWDKLAELELLLREEEGNA